MKNKKTFNLFIIFIMLKMFCSCNGQSHLNHTKHKSLPHSTITLGKTVNELDKSIMTIFQDKQNNFWFGSKAKGAYKYDGKNLILFTKKDGLCDHSIIGIQEDKFGNIYFDTTEGISKFDGQKFTTLTIIDHPISKNKWQLKPNDLWFRMGWDKSGPYRYDGTSLYHLKFPKTAQEDKFYAKNPDVSYNPYGIYSMYEDREGTLWFGTASLGLCRYDGKTISWLYEKQLTETPSGGDFGIRSIVEDKNGYFWFCNTRYRFEIFSNNQGKKEKSRVNYKKEDGIGDSKNNFPYFMSVAEDNTGDLWMATYDEGVWRNNGTTLIHYPIKDNNKNVLLFSIYKDNQDVLWLATKQSGIYKFNGKTFEAFKLNIE